MATIRAIASGNFSSGSTWNGGIVPSTGDEAVANGFSVTITQNTTVISLRNDAAGVGATVSGGFNLSTPNTITVTSIIPGATGLINVNNSSGTTTLNIFNSFSALATTSTNIISHSGNCDLVITCPNISATTTGNPTNASCITKSGSGLLTINGNVNGGASNGGSGCIGLVSTNGNILINGNVTCAVSANTTNNCHGISQTAGNLTVIGIVQGGGNISTNGQAISTSSSGVLNVNGLVAGGRAGATINKTSGAITVTGNVSGSTTAGITGTPTSITVIGDVTGATSQGINVTNAAAITITGKVTAGPSATAVVTTGGAVTVTGNVTATANGNGISTTGLVSVDGLLENTSQVQAIYSPRILIGTATTSIRYQTSLGATQLMYLGTSGVSGQPTTNNVRFGTPFGVDNTFVGTCRIPTPDTVLLGAPTDDTTGTLLMTPDQFVTELNNSSTAVAVRLRNVSTVETTGDQIVSYNV